MSKIKVTVQTVTGDGSEGGVHRVKHSECTEWDDDADFTPAPDQLAVTLLWVLQKVCPDSLFEVLCRMILAGFERGEPVFEQVPPNLRDLIPRIEAFVEEIGAKELARIRDLSRMDEKIEKGRVHVPEGTYGFQELSEFLGRALQR